MNDSKPARPVLYIDDGHPESRDQDSNYVQLAPRPRPSFLRWLFAPQPSASAPRATAERYEGRRLPTTAAATGNAPA